MSEAALAQSDQPADAAIPRAESVAHPAAMAVLVCAAYYVAAEIGIALTLHPHPVSTLWPPNATLLALLLLTPTRLWWTVVLAALPAHLFVELRSGIPLSMVLCWFISNSTEALIGAALIRWLGKGPARFDSFRRVGIFVVATLLSVFLSSFLDAGFVRLNAWGTGSYWYNWRLRSFSNVLATLTLVPLIVTWGSGGLNVLRRATSRRIIEGGVLLLSLLAVSLFVFTGRPAGPNTTPALVYAPLPFLLWSAVRFGPAATSGCLLLVALLAIWGAIGGDGPFVASTPAENVVSLQTFLIVIAVPLMALAAALRERLQAQAEARQSEEQLKLALSAAQLGTWEWKITGDEGSWSDKSREIFGLGDAPARSHARRVSRAAEPGGPAGRVQGGAAGGGGGRALRDRVPDPAPQRGDPLGAGQGKGDLRQPRPARSPARRERGRHGAQACLRRAQRVEEPL